MAYRAVFEVVTPSLPDLASPSPSGGHPPIVVLRRFLDHLLQGYRALGDGTGSGAIAPEEITARRTSLTLAAAVLRDLETGETRPDRPHQVAVVGPTQVGKSTVVNLLMGQRVAEVSPLAGFTIHPTASPSRSRTTAGSRAASLVGSGAPPANCRRSASTSTR